MASGLVEKVEKWTVREESTTENGHTKYKKEEERTTKETKDGETKRNTETTKEFSTTPAAPSRACIEDKSSTSTSSTAPGVEAESEDKKDSYVLSDIDDKENFFCTLGNRCLLGDAKKKGTKKMEYKTRQWHEKCFACCVCTTPIGTKSFIPREQEIYCTGCYEEKFATRCIKCDKIITTGGVTYKQQPWHRECFTCTNCSTSLAGQRFTSRDEKPYCADCFGELFAKRCTACIKPITGIGGTRFISFEDRHWHNDCFICATCSNSLVGKGFITDGSDILCPDCAKERLM